MIMQDNRKKAVIPEGSVGNLGGNGSPIEAFGDDVVVFALKACVSF